MLTIDSRPAVDFFWNRLLTIRKVNFTSSSRVQSGWEGTAEGTVEVVCKNNSEILFNEKGHFTTSAGNTLTFRNIFRWTLSNNYIRLEHLRYGMQHPVYLFDLEPVNGRSWKSVSPHICVRDHYSCSILINYPQLLMQWNIDGPKKKEDIRYIYQ